MSIPKPVSASLLAPFLLLVPYLAHAGLTGDTVSAHLDSNFFPGPSVFTHDTAIIGDGVEFQIIDEAIDPTYGWLYTDTTNLDFSDNSIHFWQTIDVPGTAGIGGRSYVTSYSLFISDLNWNGTNVALSPSQIVFDSVSLISFSNNSAEIFIPGTDFYFGIWGEYHFTQSLHFDVSPIPEPNIFAFLVLGIPLVLLRARRPPRN